MPDKYSHPARVRLLTPSEKEKMRVILQERDLEEEIEELFLWDAEISNDLLDSHFTHMSETTLQNYAADAQEGVAFLKGHNWHELPLGYSLTGQFEGEGDKKRVVASFYTIRGLAETNDLITRMKYGLLRDVSVGFYGGRMDCDICGLDFWECRHFPGLKYEIKEGDVVREVLATFTVEDARLSEVSGVYDGSTPDAMILKAERAAKAGELTKEQVEVLQQRYRIALPASRSHPAPDVAPTTGEKQLMDEKQFNRFKTILIESGIVPEEQRTTLDEESAIVFADKMAKRLKDLEPQAEEGRQYRKDLVDEALAEGVRAQGNDFDKELYESTLSSSSLPVIKRMRDDWKKVADKELPTGRTTIEGDVEEREVKKTPSFIPDSAYM